YIMTQSNDRQTFSDSTATPEICTLSLHDALPIYGHRLHQHRQGGDHRKPRLHSRHADRLRAQGRRGAGTQAGTPAGADLGGGILDRKSTRLNSSHVKISYAVFCLKKKITVVH